MWSYCNHPDSRRLNRDTTVDLELVSDKESPDWCPLKPKIYKVVVAGPTGEVTVATCLSRDAAQSSARKIAIEVSQANSEQSVGALDVADLRSEGDGAAKRWFGVKELFSHNPNNEDEFDIAVRVEK